MLLVVDLLPGKPQVGEEWIETEIIRVTLSKTRNSCKHKDRNADRKDNECDKKDLAEYSDKTTGHVMLPFVTL